MSLCYTRLDTHMARTRGMSNSLVFCFSFMTELASLTEGERKIKAAAATDPRDGLIWGVVCAGVDMKTWSMPPSQVCHVFRQLTPNFKKKTHI